MKIQTLKLFRIIFVLFFPLAGYFFLKNFLPIIVTMGEVTRTNKMFDQIKEIESIGYSFYSDSKILGIPTETDVYSYYFRMKDGGAVLAVGSIDDPKQMRVTRFGKYTFYSSCRGDKPTAENISMDLPFQKRVGIFFSSGVDVLKNYTQIQEQLSTWKMKKFVDTHYQSSENIECIYVQEI